MIVISASIFILNTWLIFADAKLPSGHIERQCSNSSICLNGGECVLSSTRLNSAKCSTAKSYFSDFDQTCLTVVHSSSSFEAAQKECQKTGGHLIWVTNKQKLGWLKRQLNNDSNGFWLGGKVDGMLKWQPNGTQFQLRDFEVDDKSQERAAVDTDSKCLSLIIRASQPTFILEPCDHLHSFICESPTEKFEYGDTWYAQCRCRRGFAGRYCQWKKDEDEAYDRWRCANESLNAVCTEGTLVIDYAAYGRTNETPTCQPSSATNCVDSSSLVILINKCQGRKSCRVERISDLFESQSCPSKGMGLLHRFRCSQEPDTQCPLGTTFENERCYEFSDSRTKKSYWDAWLNCARKGGELAYFNESVNFGQMLGKLQPPPDSEYWLHNNSIGKLPLIGPRRPECLSTSWWSPAFLSQLPCYAKLGWICQFVPSGFGAPRILDVPGATHAEETEKQCAEFVWGGQVIPATAECEDVQVKCPADLEGYATFTCQCDTVNWTKEPNLSDCMSKSIAPLKELASTAEEPLNVMRRFHEEIKKLVQDGHISSGDIIAFVESAENHLLPKAHQLLLDQKQTPEWRENFSRQVSKSIGGTGDQLLSDNSKSAWMELNDDQRIEKAASLMTLLQNMLVVLGLGKEAGTNASVHFQNYEGYVQLASPVLQNAPMMVNRLSVQHFVPETDEVPANIEFKTGNQMQLPNINILSTLAKKPETTQMFMPVSRIATGTHVQPQEESPFEPVKFGYFTFSKLGQLMTKSTAKTHLNSDIIGTFVNDPARSINLTDNAPANFTFQHLQLEGVSNAKCVFWSLSENHWSTLGCKLLNTNKTHSHCSCSHLTSFAILMDFDDALAIYGGQGGKPKKWQATVLDLLTTIGCTISIVCLSICVLVFTLFRSLYNTRTTIHRNLCMALLLGESLFLFGIDYTQNGVFCQGIAVGLHYCFLSAFCWMLLEGYQLYLMLIKVFEASSTRIMYYYIIGYLMPALTVAVSYMISPDNYGTPSYCWINVKTSTLWAFLGPITIILIFNTCVLCIAFRIVLSVQQRDRSLADRVLGWLKGSSMLLCLLGTTWCFGFLSAIDVMQPLCSILFILFNSLQGLFIFVFHVLLNDKTRHTVGRCFRYGLLCAPSLSDSSQQSSSFQNQRSANFFSLNKNRFLQWWPLKSKSSTPETSQSSQKQSNNLGVHFKATLPFVDEEKETDGETTRKRLLSPMPVASGQNIVVERF